MRLPGTVDLTGAAQTNKNAVAIGGGAGAGAVIGAIAGGKKGAAIGAAVGGENVTTTIEGYHLRADALDRSVEDRHSVRRLQWHAEVKPALAPGGPSPREREA